MSVIQLDSADSKALMVGLGLVVVGGLIGLSGIGISGTAMFIAVRRWMLAQEEPPSALVKRKLAQAKAASQAGASAWQDGMAAPTRPR